MSQRDKGRRASLPMLLVLCGCALFLRGAAAEPDRTLSRCLPGGQKVLVETDDLGELLARWQDGKLHEDVLRGPLHDEFAKSRVGLRLGGRIEALVAALSGTPLSRLAEVGRLAPKRAALALYDIGETSFVLAVEGAFPDGVEKDLRATLEPRRHRGLAYFAAKTDDDGKGSRRAPLRVALHKGLLLVSNDAPRFQQALVLVASELSLPIEAGPAPGAAADRDPLRARLLPAEAEQTARPALRLFLSRGALEKSRHFRRYWLFGAAPDRGQLADLDGALLALSLSPLSETHGYAYREGAVPPLAEPAAEEPARLLAALPRRPFAQVQLVDAGAAAALLLELLPLPAPPPGDSDGGSDLLDREKERLLSVLSAAEPRRALEVADTAKLRPGGRARLGVALSLARPAALSVPSLEGALLAALGPLSSPEPAFTEEGGRRVLRLPLLAPFTLCLALAGDRLVLATDPELCTDFLAAKAALFRDGASLVRSLDLERTSRAYKEAIGALSRRGLWDRQEDAALYEKAIPALFELARPLRRVRAERHRRGALVIEHLLFE